MQVHVKFHFKHKLSPKSLNLRSQQQSLIRKIVAPHFLGHSLCLWVGFPDSSAGCYMINTLRPQTKVVKDAPRVKLGQWWKEGKKKKKDLQVVGYVAMAVCAELWWGWLEGCVHCVQWEKEAQEQSGLLSHPPIRRVKKGEAGEGWVSWDHPPPPKRPINDPCGSNFLRGEKCANRN